MITLNINATKIDKSALYEGKNGKYLNLVLFDNRDGPDQYGNNGFVTQDIGKERREAGERGPIIGNWKHVETRSTSQNGAKPPTQDKHNTAKANAYQPETTQDDADDEIPF